jgi:predicted ATP-grasp superfamily ATP-dependent carboligase
MILAAVHPDNLAALGVCRGLGAHGIRTAVLAPDRTAPGQYSRHARRVPCPPATDEAAFVECLVAFGRAQQERPVLFLTDDSSLVVAQRHREALEPFFRFPFGPWEVLDSIMLKDALHRALEGVVPVPRTVALDGGLPVAAAARAVGLPAILKPVLRCLFDPAAPEPLPFERVFGAKADRVHSLDELEQKVARARARGFALVLQEEVPGDVANLCSVGLVATPAGIAAAFTSRKLEQVPAEFGDGLVVRAIQAPELVGLAERAVRHFGYRGLADIEFKWDARDRTWKLLDINPRPWLWINLPTACGVNLPYAAWLGAMERPVHATAFAQRDVDTRWISARGVAIALAHGFVRGRALEVVKGVVPHLRGRRVGPLWDPGDPLFRMVLSPRFWWQTWRASADTLARLHGTRQVAPAGMEPR